VSSSHDLPGDSLIIPGILVALYGTLSLHCFVTFTIIAKLDLAGAVRKQLVHKSSYLTAYYIAPLASPGLWEAKSKHSLTVVRDSLGLCVKWICPRQQVDNLQLILDQKVSPYSYFAFKHLRKSRAVLETYGVEIEYAMGQDDFGESRLTNLPVSFRFSLGV